MKILYVINSGNIGGAEQHTLDLAQGMQERGHEVFVWCQMGPLSQMFAGLKITPITKNIRLDIDPLYIFALTKFLKTRDIDVIHSHELKASVNALVAGFLASTSVKISHTHTPISEWQISSLKKRINSFVYKTLVNAFSSREIALTESRKFIKQKEGIKEAKLEIIPNGVAVEKFLLSDVQKKSYKSEMAHKFGFPEKAFVFGNISRLTKEKGHDVLLEAFSNFLTLSQERKLNVSNVCLVIAGGGDLESTLKQKVENLGMADKVYFTGRFDDDDLVKLYASFDIFLFPTLAEGFGLVLAEAMCAGVSVICSDLDVLREVGGSTVIYFETGNPNDLVEKMYDMYMRFDRFDELRGSAQQRVTELFSEDKFLDAYEGLYKALLNI